MTAPFRLLVCGGRDYADRDTLNRTLARICEERGWITPKSDDGNWLPAIVVVHGACPTGADAMADEWAVVNWCRQGRHRPDWKKHGRAAGPIRNQEMADTRPDLGVSFPGGRGTADMVRRARAAGIEVVEVTP